MLSYASLFAASLAILGSQVFAVPLDPSRTSIVERKVGMLPSFPDATCPATTGSGLNANVLASVQLHEIASVGVGFFKVKQELDVSVCLCVHASVDSSLIALSSDVYAAANVAAKVLLQRDVLGIAEVDIKPVGKSQCTCPVGQIVGCSSGQCSCSCPAGQSYNKKTGLCDICPSDQVFNPATGTCKPLSCPVGQIVSCSFGQCSCSCPVGQSLNTITGLCDICPTGQVFDATTGTCKAVTPSARARRSVTQDKVTQLRERQATRAEIVRRIEAKNVVATKTY